jgi:uncharacterized protein (DUF1697 family)
VAGGRRYVALLRGINLAARNRVSMARLRKICEQQGGTDVRTYIASGNVVLTSSLAASTLRPKLEKAIETEFHINILVVVLTAQELADAVKRNPFPKAEPGTLHVAFAANPIAKADVDRLHGLDFPPEEVAVRGDQIYFHLPNGYGRARLPKEVDRVKVKTTVRNWRTVTALLEMATKTAD